MAEPTKTAARKSWKAAPPTLPRPMGVALPLPSTPITASNAAQVIALARCGWGDPAWAVSPDGARLALHSHTGLYIVDAVTLVELARQSGREALWGEGLAWSPDGQWLVSTGAHGNQAAHLCGADDGAPVAKMKHPRKVITGAAAPDGRLVATTCADKRIYLWDATDGHEVLAIPAGRSAVQRLAWSPGGNVLASAARGLIQLWNPATGDLLAILRGHTQNVLGLCFSPDGTCLISGGMDETLRVWGLN